MVDTIYISKDEVAVAVQRYMTWITGCRPTSIGFDYHVEMPEDWAGPAPTRVLLTGAQGRDDLGNGFPDADDPDKFFEHWQLTEAILQGLLKQTEKKFSAAETEQLNNEVGGLSRILLELLADLVTDDHANGEILPMKK